MDRLRAIALKNGVMSLWVSLALMGTQLGCGGLSSFDRDRAVARVNRRTISMQELQDALGRLSQFAPKDFTQESVRQEVVKDMIDEELLFQAALKDRIYERSPDLKRAIVKVYLEELASRMHFQPTDQELESLYNEQKQQLDSVRIRHILWIPQQPGHAPSENATEAEAQKIRQQIMAMPQPDVSDWARKFSQDLGSKDRGGDLGFLTRGQMTPELAQFAFALSEKGEISEVVRTRDGYHLLQLVDQARGFEAFRDNLTNTLQRRHVSQQIKAVLEQLKGSARIDMYVDHMMKVEMPTRVVP